MPLIGERLRQWSANPAANSNNVNLQTQSDNTSRPPSTKTRISDFPVRRKFEEKNCQGPSALGKEYPKGLVLLRWLTGNNTSRPWLVDNISLSIWLGGDDWACSDDVHFLVLFGFIYILRGEVKNSNFYPLHKLFFAGNTSRLR
jgi:hypothetical protein